MGLPLVGSGGLLSSLASEMTPYLRPRRRPKDIKQALRFQREYLEGLGNVGSLQRGETRGLLVPGYEEFATGEGYSPEEQSALLQESLGSVGTGFDVLRNRAANRLARTRNRAGYGSLLAELGREETRQKAGITRQNMIDFANEKFRRRLAGLEGLAQLYGIDTGFLANVLGQQTATLGLDLARSQKKRGLLSTIAGILNIGRGIQAGIGALRR